MLDQILHELTIEALPVAPSPTTSTWTSPALHVGKSLHVSDLELPAGVKVVDDAGTTVCLVQPPKTATVETTETVAEPEVIRKVKADDEV